MTVLIAIIAAICIWWFATGAVIALAQQGSSHAGAVMAMVTAIAIAALFGLHESLSMQSIAGTYLGFVSAIGLWAWHETSFLLGLITGPSRVELSDAPARKSRFQAAFLTVRDHEIALALTAALLLWFMYGGANLTGLLTFLLLWVMRISTKINIFLGAEHAISDMLPARLDYLKTYFRTDRTSRWFWVSLGACTVLLGAMIAAATAASEQHVILMWSLLATFCGLALIEHLFLVLPLRESALWHWAVRVCPAKSDKVLHDISTQKPGRSRIH